MNEEKDENELMNNSRHFHYASVLSKKSTSHDYDANASAYNTLGC